MSKTKTKIIKMTFDASEWNSNRALRYVKNSGHQPIKRGIQSSGKFIYEIRNDKDYENKKWVVIDKKRKVRAQFGTKKHSSGESSEPIQESEHQSECLQVDEPQGLESPQDISL